MSQAKRQVYPIFIAAEIIQKTAIKTEGGSGSSNMDINGWRRMLSQSHVITLRNG